MRQGVLLLAQVGIAVAQLSPVTVSPAVVDGLSHSSLRLTWNNSAAINAIRVRYGFTTAYDLGPGGDIFSPGTTLFSQLGETISVSGLVPNSLYHFCPQASTDQGQTWSACVDVTATTLPLPDAHPAPPQPPAEVDISYPNQDGATMTAAADCSDLQNLINQAHYGDTILIPAGAICPGSYTLPPAPEAKMFTPSAVDTQKDSITIPNHGFTAGQKVHLDAQLCLPGSAGPDIFCQRRGIGAGSDYFVSLIDANSFGLMTAGGVPVTFTVATFTANPGTATLTASAILLDGIPMRVRSTGTLPGGLDPLTTYYTLNPAGTNVLQLSLTPGGSPVPLLSAGSGTQMLADPGSQTSAIMAWPPNDHWVVVRTATPDSRFCPEGVRCLGPQWASKMARIAQRTPPTGTTQDIRLNVGLLTHHWRFVGIEFTHSDNSAAANTSTDPTPYYGFIYTRRSTSNFILDRCYIHGLGFPNRIYRAIEAFDGANMAIINSHLDKLDYWHPSVSPLNGFLPSSSDPRSVTIAPGTYAMGVNVATLSAPATITLSGVSGSGTAIVYFDLTGALHVDFPAGVQGTCSVPGCVVTTVATGSPAYPQDAAGRIAVAQIANLTILNGQFGSLAYLGTYPQSANDTEGAQSLIAGNGPGPFLLQNNTISSTGIPIHIDDSGGSWFDRDDYVVRRNYFTAPLSQSGSATSDGLHYFNRNFLEWKGGQRVLVEGNYFEHSFADVAPFGAAVVITPRAGGYSTDVMIRDNTFSNNAGALELGAVDSYTPVSKPLERIAVVNNLFDHNNGFTYAVPASRAAAPGMSFYYAFAAADLAIDHNTLIDTQGYDPVFVHLASNPMEGTSITNNFLWINDDGTRKGIDGEGFPSCPFYGLALFDCELVSGTKPEYTFANNVLLPGWNPSATPTILLDPAVLAASYAEAPNNWIMQGATIDDRLAQAGMNFAAQGNYRLSPGSTFAASGANPASDGKDVGVDFNQLQAAQGVIGTATVDTTASPIVTINVSVPDAGAACWILYGSGGDITTFARTAPDTSPSQMRSIPITGLAGGTYTFVTVCNGATNYSLGTFAIAAP